MVITVLLGILIFLAWVIWLVVHKIMKIFVKTFSKKNVSQMNKYLANMKYFKMSNVQFSMGRGLLTDHCLAIDDDHKLICILELRDKLIKENVYKYEVLKSCEIVENGINVTNEICLIVIFNVTANSVYKFNFMPYGRHEISYRKYMEITRNWHDILSIIIERNQEERLKAKGNYIARQTGT
ncbi:MAG TPA: hypothetical protein VFC84_16490 [Desulfosporosinus sp.]|nr:hypothetical protein [Desulfosporosinus sp.]